MIFLYAIPPRLGSDGERADGRLKATAAGTVCLQTRAVARRRFQTSGRRHRNRSGGFCCFSTPKSREKKVFLNLTLKVREISGRLQFSQTFFFLYFWGQKYQKPPHVVFRGIARAAALHGARKIKPMRHPVTGAPQLAPSFSASNESAELLCRQRRHYLIWQCTPDARSSLLFLPASGCVSLLFRKTNHPHNSIFLFPQGDSRLGSDGERADGGLKATAAGTVCLQTRAVARRRFQSSGRRHRNRSGGFCCFSPSKSREKRVFPEAAKGLREAFCCLSLSKAEKRERVFSGVFLKSAKGLRAASRHQYKKKQSTKNTTLPQGSYAFDLPREQPPSSP